MLGKQKFQKYLFIESFNSNFKNNIDLSKKKE